jgi:hypothetical protein
MRFGLLGLVVAGTPAFVLASFVHGPVRFFAQQVIDQQLEQEDRDELFRGRGNRRIAKAKNRR